jgi:putative photosynthetic complex assembly protein
MSAIDTEPFPRGALIAAGALVLASLAAASFGRYQNLNAPIDATITQAPISEQVELLFFDSADGNVTIKNAATNATIAVLAPGEDAFIRSVMRGLARNRRVRDIGSEVAFQLIRYETGKLEIHDPTTSKRIDLRAFGPSNRDAFARLLPTKSAS